MSMLKKGKEDLEKDVEALKTNKKIRVDQDDIKEQLKKADKKKQAEIEKLKENNISKAPAQKNYHAIVRLEIGSGTNVEEIAEVGATFSYKEGKQTLKVVNKDNEVIFEEYKPDWQNKFKYLDKKTIEDKIEELKNILKAFQNDEIKQKKDKETGMVYYEEDYLAMLREKEQELAILTLGKHGSYSSHKDGIPIYTFEIIGFFKIPIYRYTDKSIMGLPPAPKIVIGQYLTEVLYKNFKADETRAERIILTIFAVVMGIALLGAMWILWYTTGMVGDTALSVQGTADSLSNLMNVSDLLEGILNNTDSTNQILDKTSSVPEQNMTKVVN